MDLKRRGWTLALLIVIVPIGFYTKVYSGPLSTWVHDSLGGVLYVIFWSFLLSLFARDFRPFNISASVLVITSILEVLQLWHPTFLETLRSTFLGRTLLGTTFSWLDFVHYIIGFVLSIVMLRWVMRMESKTHT